MGKLKVAIIGCGTIYKAHADVIKESEDAELVAVVDIEKEKAEDAAELYQCSPYTDYKKLLNIDLDVVHICTPHYLHCSIAVELMEAGFDVLVEKPIAINLEEATRMIDTSQKTQKRLGVVFQNRFNKNILLAKRIVKEGSLGMILGIKGIVTWHRDEKYYKSGKWRGFYKTEGGGVLINQSIHTLDLLQWFGGNVRGIKGNVDTRVLRDVIEVEDTAEATIYFENGTIGLFYATNCYTSDSPVEIELNLEKGSIKLSGNMIIINDQEDKYKDIGKKDSKYKPYWGSGHQKLIEGFYSDIIENKEDYTINGEEGIKALKLIEGINYSSKTGEMFLLSKQRG